MTDPTSANPYETPDAPIEPAAPRPKRRIGRLLHFVCQLFIVGLTAPIQMVSLANDPVVLGSVLLISVAMGVYLMALRFRDLGWRGRWALLGFVPVLNFVVVTVTLIYPGNYANTRKLDRTAKNIIGIFLAAVFLFIISGLIFG
ncbi:MAG: DUF805 domain-containing protein [Pseudomonadota bacterium]